MRSRVDWLFEAAMVAALLVGAAQAPADFSGQWAIEAEPATAKPAPGTQPQPPRGDMGSGWGSPLTITQDASQLVVEYVLYSRYDLQPPLRFVYKLDGSESKNAVMLGHTTQARVARAAWDGAGLRITTTYPATDPASGKPFTTEVTQRLSLESPTTLIVEATRAGVLGGRPTTTRTVYRKVPR